jgi:hypothetical protein
MNNNERYPVLRDVTKVELVAYGIALVTNRSIGKFLRTDNRKEQINVFACYLQANPSELFCYAILRCANTYCFDVSDNTAFMPNYHMEDKILFLFVNPLNDIASSGAKKIPDEVVKGIAYNTFQFANRISSDDLYKILVPRVEEHDANLKQFFDAVKEGINFLAKKEYYGELDEEVKKTPRRDLEQRRKNPGSGSGARDAAGLGLGLFLGL